MIILSQINLGLKIVSHLIHECPGKINSAFNQSWDKPLKRYKEKTRLSFVFLKVQNKTRAFSDVRWDRIIFLVIRPNIKPNYLIKDCKMLALHKIHILNSPLLLVKDTFYEKSKNTVFLLSWKVVFCQFSYLMVETCGWCNLLLTFFLASRERFPSVWGLRGPPPDVLHSF